MKMSQRWTKVLLLAGVTNWSCANETTRPPSTDINVEGGSSPNGRAAGRQSYPVGPYGVANPKVGDIVEDLNFLGYMGSGELIVPSHEMEETSFSEIRKGEARYVLVHVSSLWCGTCQAEAFYLSQYTNQIIEAGGAALEILIDGDTLGLDPTQEELDVWVLNNDLRVTTMIPGDDNVRRVFPDKDIVYIIDMSTMEVVWREVGPGLAPTTTEIGAGEMLAQYLSE